MRNKLFITLALVCALGFGSSVANAQCGGGSMKMSKHRHAKMRHARKHAKRHRKAKSSANMTSGNENH